MTAFPSGIQDPLETLLFDLDEDGDLDFFVGSDDSTGGIPDHLYANDGTGKFTLASSAMVFNHDETFDVEAADLDGDGDVELFLANRYRSRVLVNHRRQVSWLNAPRVGVPLTMAVDGPASSPWFLAYAALPFELSLPPYGTLLLHPTSLTVAGFGTLDGNGEASLALPVPANPVLVGGSVYWQGVVGATLRFTNLEITTLTDL